MKFKTSISLFVVLQASIGINAQTFQDNPSDGSAGDFPSKWELIKGSAQIGTFGGSKVILLSNNGIITPQLGSKNYLAETFTLQFDAYFDRVRKTVDDEYYQVRFWDGMTHLTFASQKGNGFYNPIQIYRYRVRVVGRSNGTDRILHDVSDNNLKSKDGVWTTILILYDRGSLKISIGGVQILNLKEFLIKPAMISIQGTAHEFGVNHVRAIKNIRLDGIVNTAVATTNTNNPADNSTNTSGQTGNNNSSGNTGIKINDLLDGKSDPEGSSVFLGLNAGATNSSADNKNTGLGFESLKNNSTGEKNTSIGYESLLTNTTGGYNTAIGAYSLTRNSTGNFNTGTGNGSLDNNTIGNNNTATGYRSLFSNTTGINNTALGYKAGHNNLTGSGNVFLGFNAGYKETGSNKLYINNSDADASTALLYGEFDNKILRTNGRLQIGNPTSGGYTFPALDGSSKQVLQTDGRGNLRWVNITSSGDNNLPQQIDSSKVVTFYSGLEAIDEGNGIGWRIKGRNSIYYGNLGLGAIDFSGTYSEYDELSGRNYGATGHVSFASGNLTKASGVYSSTMGYATEASGMYSTAIGGWTTASELHSTAMGSRTTASGKYSTAMGNRTNAESYNSVVLGTYNIGGGDPDKWIDSDPLFEIGTGSSNSGTSQGTIRKNALTVLKNGNIGIGIFKPNVRLHITGGVDASLSNGSGFFVVGDESKINLVVDNNEILVRNNGVASTLYLQHNGGDVSVGGKIVHTSDMRLKKNITLLSYGLSEILKMKPVAYQWKNNSNQESKDIGLLAQDIQPLIKEIVHIGNDKAETLSISYTELIPVLIKAIQEQQNIIEKQNKNYDNLLKRVEQLESFPNQKK